MAANTPVAFGAVLAGGLLLEHGLATAKGAFASPAGGIGGGAPAAAPGATIANADLGPTTNPIPGATEISSLDQGVDGTTQTFVSPFNGKVVVSNPSDSGWNGGGYVAIQNAKDPNYVYYAAEGLTPTVQVGQMVTVGQQIATPRANPYNGTVGNFEIGRANPASPGQPLAQVIGNAAGMVWDFYHWLQSLGIPANTGSTDRVGHA